MTDLTAHPPAAGGITGWLRRAEAWLDDRGRPAWIVAVVAGLVVFWPAGLALLAYMIWGKRMFANACGHRRHRHDASREMLRDLARTARPSGNAAFDAYKAETLRRLQAEQEAFEAFLDRLRAAKDKTEFDAFMEERARAVAAETAAPGRPDPSPAAGY